MLARTDAPGETGQARRRRAQPGAERHPPPAGGGKSYWHRREQYKEALAAFERARQYLPAEGEALKRQLGGAFEEVGSRLAWRRRKGKVVDSLPSEEAASALTQAIELGVENTSTYHTLGAVQKEN